MHLEVQDLTAFYRRPLGQLVRRLLTQRLRSRWRRAHGLTVIGLGFASPFLGSYRGEAVRMGAFMPAGQGGIAWPAHGPVQVVLVDEGRMPLPDNAVDRLLVVHCLETSENARETLREVWRVLAPEGRLLLMVPNRRSIWSRREATPFGHGRPYSRAQLERLLADALFHPIDWSTAVHVPPFEWRPFIRWAAAFERLGARFFSRFGGILIVEARKEVAETLMTPSAARRQGRLAPAGMPRSEIDERH